MRKSGLHQNALMMLALAKENGWHMEQMDVTTAFLYAGLEEEMYIVTLRPCLRGNT